MSEEELQKVAEEWDDLGDALGVPRAPEEEARDRHRWKQEP